jgi:hypothetical protein
MSTEELVKVSSQFGSMSENNKIKFRAAIKEKINYNKAQLAAINVANTLVLHAGKGFYTGTWSPNKVVQELLRLRQVPTNYTTNYTNDLKTYIQTRIEARKNINNAHRNRALGALNSLFKTKPALK